MSSIDRQASLDAKVQELVQQYGHESVLIAVNNNGNPDEASRPSTPQLPGAPEIENKEQRRLSVFLGDNSELQANLLKDMKSSILHAKSFASALLDVDIKVLVKSFLNAIKLSNVIEDDVEVWFNKIFPTLNVDEKMQNVLDNTKLFLQNLAKLIRPMMKLSRFGVAGRILFSLSVSYFDLVTDVLVAIEYRKVGLLSWFYLSATFIGLALFWQVLLTIMQYHRHTKFQLVVQSAIAATGLSPVFEGFGVWIGREANSTKLMFAPSVMLAVVKSVEVGFESLPESIIQSIAIMQLDYEQISSVLVASLFASFGATAFIMTDANISIARSYSYNMIGDEYVCFVPNNMKKAVPFVLSMLLFNFFYSMSFALCTATLFFVQDSFRPILGLMTAELLIYCSFKVYEGEMFSFAFVNMPNRLVDIPMGILLKTLYYVTTSAAPLTIVFQPWNGGPHMFVSLILYRFIMNAVVVLYSAPFVASKSWMKEDVLLTAFFAIWTLSLIFLVTMYRCSELEVNLFKRMSGKMFYQQVVANRDKQYLSQMSSKKHFSCLSICSDMDASKPHTVCYLPLPPNSTSLNIAGPASSPTCAYITPADPSDPSEPSDPSDPSDPNNTPTLTVATFSTTSVTSIGSIPFPDAESCCVDLSSRVYVFTSSHVSILVPEFTPTGDPCIPATSTLNPVHPDPLAWTFGSIRHSTSLRPSTLILELLYSPNLSLMTFNENNTVTRTDLRIPLCTNPKSITKLRRTGDDICIFYDLFYDIYTVIGSMVYSSQRYNYDSASTSWVTSLLTALSTTPSNLHIDYNAYTTATHLRIYSPPPSSLSPI
ncbi:hypothetical protein TrLO_g4499 [Triparma laevis f. longispina]|uniref:Uncharacterized protein n=1 Tax=Triparma laevis f. longispina TaxID=1714387 RepID=A0A9W6ZSF0_9STRA|nr:hypothetical protein TrLO_g4499 [Triparma laevis f. longispina]